MTAAREVIEVVRPGMLGSIQDGGRPGLGHFGVSPAGAMDPLALTVANRLAGNAAEAPALELTGPGAELLFLADTPFALAGGDLGAALDGAPLPALGAFAARAGQRLTFGGRTWGARVLLTVGGGLVAPLVLGSAATDLAAGLGGFAGRPLSRGQRLLAPTAASAAAPAHLPALAAVLAAAYAEPLVLRFVPEVDGGAPPEARAAFTARAFRLSGRSNRTGYRFEGQPLPVRPDPDRLSEPTAPGALQLPPDGLPILLMAERNTTGGYPRLGHLATVDRPKAAQLWPGDEIRFQPVTVAEAQALARARSAALAL